MLRFLFLAIFTGFLATCAPAPQATPLPPGTTRHVVLVHGFMETGSNWHMFKNRLEAQGFDCLVPKLRPNDGRGGLERLALGLKRDIDAAYGPNEPISLIGFSMGGLVSRYYLQELGGAKRCQQLITIASPHHGTDAAWYYPTQGTKQMRPGSPFLLALEKSESNLGPMPVTSYRTPHDLVIVPSESSIWKRADNLAFPVLLHPWMLNSNAVLRDVIHRLRRAPVHPAPPRAKR